MCFIYLHVNVRHLHFAGSLSKGVLSASSGRVDVISCLGVLSQSIYLPGCFCQCDKVSGFIGWEETLQTRWAPKYHMLAESLPPANKREVLKESSDLQ